MAKIKYYYDTETCRYERVKVSTFDLLINAIGLLFICLLIGFGFSLLYSKYFPSQQELRLMKENEDLLFSYDLVRKELSQINQMVAEIQKRDDNIYRVIMEADPLPREVRSAGAGGIQKYEELLEGRLTRKDLIISTLSKVDKVKRQLYIQAKSYDEVSEMATDKAQMLASIPAIQPVSNKDLFRFASGYGVRIHPIHKIKMMHWGCDFSAPQGTPIYATGDGKVELSGSEGDGYGIQVVIDHGFGYKTRYAHMSVTSVRRGQTVKRGQKIGEVGNTGQSVAPHLHYEVEYKGRKVDPIQFFANDLTPEQYDTMLKMATLENQALGY